MNSNPYRVLDRPDGLLLGRSQPLKLVLDRLNELHVCIIAPRFFGKTRLLRQVARVATENGFSQCLVWNLWRHTPNNDEEFYQSFSQEIERQIEAPGQDLTEWFQAMGTGFEAIKGVFQELDKARQNILLALDEIEGVLQAGSVTKNVWDNLRDLADLTSVRFVTASRLPLRELCPLDSKTSPFWNIFHPTPVRFGAFQPNDWADVLQPFAARKVTVDESARKELNNWTGGIPVLVMAVCERLFAECSDGQTLSKTDADAAAEQVMRDYREHIETLWGDLPTAARLDVVELARRREISRADLAAERIELLVQRGFATDAGGNKLRSNCRIMERHAAQLGESLPELKRLFSTLDDYERNITEVLQLRLAQLRGLYADAEQHLGELLKALPKPETAKLLIRNVADSCLELLLNFEFPNGTIDGKWVNDWKCNGKLNNPENDRDILAGKVPCYRGPRMKLLSLLHDEKTIGTAKGRRSTFILLESVSKAGGFGQHANELGESIPRSFVTAIASVAVELLHQVKEDTSSKTRS